MNDSRLPPPSPLNDINLTHLRTFRLVLQQGGYAAAARVSDLSVPAIWQHIRVLEKTYGVALFHRVGRRVVPTEAAVRLGKQIESVLVRLDSTLETVRNSSHGSHLRLVTGVRMMLEDLAIPLSNFYQRHNVRLTIRQGNEQRAEALLIADEIDLAMTLEPGPHKRSPLIRYEPAYAIDFFSIARPDHLYATTPQNDLQELARHRLVVTAVGTHGRDALDQAFHREGLQSRIAVETDTSAFTIACVSSGIGVGVLAGRLQGSLCQGLVTRSLREQLGRCQIVFMWRKGRILSEAMLDLIDEIKQLDHGV